jgi:hypothetical protein
MPNNIQLLISEAVKRFEALPIEEQVRIRREQQRSWVVGEMMLEHPEMTRLDADIVYDKMLAGVR